MLTLAACRLLDSTFGDRWREAPLTTIEGTTNFVARLDLGTESFAVRAARLDDMSLQIDRHSECAAVHAAAAADVGAEVIACDPARGILITRWIEGGVWTAAQAAEHDRIEAIGRLLQRLHALAPPPGLRTLNLRPNLHAQWKTLCTLSPEVARTLAGLNNVASGMLQRREVLSPSLCHNDVHCRNIAGNGSTLRLIDWEYSGVGDPLFDLASYSQSHDLNSEQQSLLLSAYGSQERERFIAECWLFDWTCILWMAVVTATMDTAVETTSRVRFEFLLKRLSRS